MPKIKIKDVGGADETAPADRLRDSVDYWTGCDRCIKDLLFVQNIDKMYINEKKQIQNLIMHLYETEYYTLNETALDKIGLVKVN